MMRHVFWSVAGITFLWCVSACVPDPPFCNNDEHCERVDGKGFCINGLCSACRDDTHCGAGAICEKGACQAYQVASECPEGQLMQGGDCKRLCDSDAGCGDGQLCEQGVCAEAECVGDIHCKSGQHCERGRCVLDPLACNVDNLENVYFDFDETAITVSQVPALERNATCINSVAVDFSVAGHTDERGTEEYNLALGEGRAESVKTYLGRLGVNVERLSTLTFGEYRPVISDARTEAEHLKNRRVELSAKE